MDKTRTLQYLLDITNKNIGYIPNTPSEFDDLSVKIHKKTGMHLSQSSLKRLWGYVKYAHLPSHTTLNILARFNNFDNWEAFVENYEYKGEKEGSNFIDGTIANSDSLSPGDILNVTWEEDKRCKAECLGDKRLRVISSENIKLLPGDVFRINTLCVGMPFYAFNVVRDDETFPGYIGARNNGITSIIIQKAKI